MLVPDRPNTDRLAPAQPAAVGPLSAEQLLSVQAFVSQVGSVEHARRALEMLLALRRVT